jgi:hypothetical protein
MGVRGYKWQGEYSREYCTNLEINGSPEVPPAGERGPGEDQRRLRDLRKKGNVTKCIYILLVLSPKDDLSTSLDETKIRSLLSNMTFYPTQC